MEEKIVCKDFVEETVIALRAVFEAEVSQEENGLSVTFPNGQRFEFVVTEKK